MPYNLKNAAPDICKKAGQMLDQKLFVSVLPLIGSFAKDGLLYWNLHNNQGYVVFNPTAKTAHKVFKADEVLSDKNLCPDSLLITASLSIGQFVNDYNDGVTDYSKNIIYSLPNSLNKLCKTVSDIFEIEEFLDDIKEQTGSIIRDGKLFWNLHLGQGYVVVDPEKGTVHKVSSSAEVLTDSNLCDTALAFLVDYDIYRFVGALAEKAALDIFTAMIFESALESELRKEVNRGRLN